MIIITAVGKDRPGMAHALAQKLAQSGCNIEDTTMTRLSGEFAMILIVSPQGISIDDLSQTLKPLETSHGLFINCRAIEDSAEDENDDAPRYLLSVYGPERAGLVAQMTGVLAQQNINITDVQTRVASAGAAYIMLFEIELPTGVDAQTLTASLEDAAREIGAQVSLRAIETETL